MSGLPRPLKIIILTDVGLVSVVPTFLLLDIQTELLLETVAGTMAALLKNNIASACHHRSLSRKEDNNFFGQYDGDSIILMCYSRYAVLVFM